MNIKLTFFQTGIIKEAMKEAWESVVIFWLCVLAVWLAWFSWDIIWPDLKWVIIAFATWWVIDQVVDLVRERRRYDRLSRERGEYCRERDRIRAQEIAVLREAWLKAHPPRQRPPFPTKVDL